MAQQLYTRSFNCVLRVVKCEPLLRFQCSCFFHLTQCRTTFIELRKQYRKLFPSNVKVKLGDFAR